MMRIHQKFLSGLRLAIKRVRNHMRLVLLVFVGILASVTMISGAPIYISSLENQSVRTAIDAAVTQESSHYLNLNISTRFIPLNEQRISRLDEALSSTLDPIFGTLITGKIRHIKSSFFIFSLESSTDESNINEGVPHYKTNSPKTHVEGYFQNLSDFHSHVTYVSGAAPGKEISKFRDALMIEVSVSRELAERFNITLGNTIVAMPSLDYVTKLCIDYQPGMERKFCKNLMSVAKVVGFFEPKARDDPFWQGDSNQFLNPYPNYDENIKDPTPFLAMFVAEESFIKGIGKAHSGSVVDITWYNHIDENLIRQWSKGDLKFGLDTISRNISIALPGAELRSGLQLILKDFQRVSFVNSVPLLLLMAVVVLGLLYFSFTLITYLSSNMQSEIALLKSRGLSTSGLLGQFMFEGFLIVGAAVLIAPFLAIGLVSLMGLLPYFGNITDGSLLAVQLSIIPFLASITSGIVCLLIFVVQGFLSLRTNQINMKVAISRPPSVPFIQRYYLDLVFLIAVGAIFWELKVRGQISTGGILNQDGINEVLLISPMLCLVAISLFFMRAFPPIVKFCSGESDELVKLVAWLSLVGFVWFLLIDNDLYSSNEWPVIGSVLGCFFIGLFVYNKSSSARYITFSISVMIVAVIALWFLSNSFLSSGIALAFWVLVSTPFLLGLFQLLRYISIYSPVWLTLTLWQMSRNPLQYSGLILLLVIATGIAVFSTTLGETLGRSYEDRVRYSIGADARVVSTVGNSFFGIDSVSQINNRYSKINGVESVSAAVRRVGTVGSGDSSLSFDLLAIESGEFVPWSRRDFSSIPMSENIRRLVPSQDVTALVIPKGSTDIGIKFKPMAHYPLMSLWLQVIDDSGWGTTITFDRTGLPQWSDRTVALDKYQFQYPVKIVSVQVSEPGLGDTGTPGAIFIDDIYIVHEGTKIVIESFEGDPSWSVIPTSSVSLDELDFSLEAAESGKLGAVFQFGKERNAGVRGIFWSQYGNTIPVIASDSFNQKTGLDIGEKTLVRISGILVPVEIVGEVSYFSTLDPRGDGFLVMDLTYLLYHLSVIDTQINEIPNETYLGLASSPGSIDESQDSDLSERRTVVKKLISITGFGRELMETSMVLDNVRNNPLIVAGWKAMTLVAVVIAFFIASAGYLVYVGFAAERIRYEIASLRTIGLSRNQIIWLVTLGHSIILVIGLGIGSWTGIQMTKLMLGAVAVSEEGKVLLPPPIFAPDWMLLTTYLALFVLVFSSCVLFLSRHLTKVNLAEVARTEN